MTVTVLGAQLGDEGKGRVVDLIGEDADVVVRYQGGDNAGHTVVHGGEEYRLSLVPSGVVRGTVGVLGNGCVVNPATLFEEIDALRDRGLDPDVRVAQRAHVIFPYHRVLDGAEEAAKGDTDLAAGTTGRGIGPAYEDKAARRGVRVGDLLAPDALARKLAYVVPRKRALAESVYGVDVEDGGGSDAGDADAGSDRDAGGASNDDADGPGGGDADRAFDADALHEEYARYGERLREEGMAVNAGEFLAARVAAGENVVLEGAQGTAIDIDHGIYPYTTSSNPTAGYAATGSGLGVTTVGRGEVVGVVKAYLSRVGTGPLPTELSGDLAEYIREEGGEYGTVTGRPRRVGWLDVPMLRHAARANGFTGLAVNHLDVLAGLDEVKVAHTYDLDGETIRSMPPTTERWGECEPNLRPFEGWPAVDWDAVSADGYDAIPANARAYLSYLSDELDAPIVAVGVGPAREQSVVLENPFG